MSFEQLFYMAVSVLSVLNNFQVSTEKGGGHQFECIFFASLRK